MLAWPRNDPLNCGSCPPKETSSPILSDSTSVGRSMNGGALITLITPEGSYQMKDLPVHITPHDVQLSLRLRRFIERKVATVSRFAGDILGAEVILRRTSGADHPFSVSARLALPGRDLYGTAVHGNPYRAINELVARLARLSRKRKTRLANRSRRPGKWPGWNRRRKNSDRAVINPGRPVVLA